MARNWESGRQTGLGTLVDAYNQNADRLRGIDKEKADSQRSGQEYAFRTTKNYMKPKYDSNGFTTGYEDNQDTYSRNKPILEKMKPEYFRDPPAPAAQPQAEQPAERAPEAKPVAKDYTKEPGQELSPSGRPMGKTYEEEGNRSPNGEPSSVKPLLKDPALAQQEAQLAHQGEQADADRQAQGQIEEKRLSSGKKALVGKGTTAVQYDQNDPGVSMGRNAQGVDQRLVNATKTVQQFDEPAEVLGGANASSTTVQNGAQRQGAPSEEAASRAEYNPDPYMMGRITDMATTPTPRASDQMISVSSLPPALLEGTGLEGFKGQIPSSLLKDILSGKTKLDIAKLKGQQGGANGITPEQVPFLQMVDKGTDPGDALAEAAKQGVQITKPFSDAVYKSMGGKARKDGQGAVADRFKTTQQRIKDQAYSGYVSKAAEQWRKGVGEVMASTTFARNAKAMANSGNTAGMVGAIRNMLARASEEKGPLSVYDVKQFGGEEGWYETANQFMTRGINEGMTPENIKLVNRLADIYIKAGVEKSRHMAKPILGGLRAGIKARFPTDEEAADRAEQLMRDEMDLTIEFGDDGKGGYAGSETEKLKDKDGKQVMGEKPKPKADASQLRIQYDKTVKAINSRGYKDDVKAKLLKEAADAYKAQGGQ